MVSCDGGSKVPAEKPLDLEDDRQLVSYAVGRETAINIKEVEDLDIDVFVLALREAVAGHPAQINDSAVTALNARVRNEINEKRRRERRQLEESNLAAAQAFLEQNKANEGVVTTESGLQYIVLTEGKGARPKSTDQVKVHYHGTLLDGTVFDSSRDRGEPTTFAVTGVIKGWTEALQLMRVGGKMRLFVPPELAYGRRGTRGPIGPNVVLVFEVELLEIVK
jgi:FKBP-type peptidyl-prolyl cis-trans isomerase